MKRILCSLLVATLPFGSVLADAPKSKNAKVTLVYQHELPSAQGKSDLTFSIEPTPIRPQTGEGHAASLEPTAAPDAKSIGPALMRRALDAAHTGLSADAPMTTPMPQRLLNDGRLIHFKALPIAKLAGGISPARHRCQN